MDLAPDNGKTDFIYSALEIIDRIFFVTKLSPVQLKATGEGKRGKRAQLLLTLTDALNVSKRIMKNGLTVFNSRIFLSRTQLFREMLTRIRCTRETKRPRKQMRLETSGTTR